MRSLFPMEDMILKQKILSLCFAAALFFFILTFSISLPIYCRPFYYAQIDTLKLERSGFTREEIINAYDDVMDYLTLPGREFGTGVMRHSEEGAAHFADCKVLFDLNAMVLILSAVSVAVFLILRKCKRIDELRIGRRSAGFWSAIAAIVLPLVLGGLVALDFDRAFVIFHSLFFPGKDNWLFFPEKDPIIEVLPMEYFMNCAVLIGVGILVASTSILIRELILSQKSKRSER